MCLRYAHRSIFILCLLALNIPGFAQAGSSPANSTAQAGSTPAGSAAPANSAAPSNSAAQPQTLRVNTRLVVVDVVATDGKGAPVTDLKSTDFVVQEEGVEQPLQVFSFHQPGSEPPAPAGPFVSPQNLPRGIYTNVPAYRTGGALNVVLLDALNSNLINQANMRDAMLKFLEKIPSGEPVAIYLLGNKLTLLQDFTSDPELLKKAVAGMKREGSRGLSNPAGNTAMAETPIGTVAAATIGMMNDLRSRLQEFHDQQNAVQSDYRVRFTLDVLNALARSLAGYPGRKNLVWISETFPITIGAEKVGTSFNTRDYSWEVARTGSLLSNAQVAIYPVDARSLAGSAQFDVAADPNPISAPEIRKQTLSGDMGKVTNAEREEQVSSHGTMNDLAEKTGGRAFYNTNNLEVAVRKSMEDGSSYYTLGYSPANKTWDGKFRRITVKSDRPGVKLHYRQGYFAVEPQSYANLDTAEKSGELARALSLDFPAATALRFQAAVMPPSPASQNKVVVNYAVDPHQLAFELQGDGLRHASVDCAVIVYSQAGETLQTLSNTMMASLKPDEYNRVMQKSFPCRQTFEAPPGQYRLRLGVRDARTGLVGTLDAPLTIAEPSGGPPASKP